ncbi:MAG: sensor histidine kinase [Emticicia sp.]|uniref:sensor histidine kinase n=1 Tax=Emticicia sp. TaxID=1930953 RepID=UPI003BA7A4EE
MRKIFFIVLLLITNNAFAGRPVIDSLSKKVKDISIQKQSFGRDIALINALWELGYYAIYFREKNDKLLLDSLQRLTNRTQWQAGKGIFLINQSFYDSYARNDFSSGLTNALKAKEILRNTNNARALAYANLRISSIMLWNLGNEKKDKFSIAGIQAAKEMIALGKKIHDFDIQCQGYIYVANHYNFSKDSQNALQNLEKADEIISKYKVGYLTENLFYGTYGVFFSYTNQFEKALEYWEKCLKIATPQNDFYTLSSMNRLKADYYYQYAKKKDFDTALKLAQESYKYANQFGVLKFITNAERELYMINRLKGNNAVALVYLERFWKNNDSLSREKIQKVYADYDLATKESQIHKLENLQLIKEAQSKAHELEYLKTLRAKNDSLIFQKNEKVASEYKLILRESEVKKLENEKLQTEASQQKTILNLLIISLLLGIGLVLYFFKNNQKLKAKNREIEGALLKGQTLERKRVAQELHDNLSAKISGIRWRLEAIQPNFSVEKHKQIYESSVNALSEVYTDVRLISHNLLPAELETKGLVAATKNLVQELNSLEKTKFCFDSNLNTERLPNKIEYELFSIILELSNNILKHSEATKAMIGLMKEDNLLKLLVKDNGVGIDNKHSKKGMGLSNIQSRVAALNGNLSLITDAGVVVNIDILI